MYFEYRLDVILWRLGFFINPSVSRFYISQGYIFVNSHVTKSHGYVLKKGDLVQIDPILKNFIHIFKNKRVTYVNPFYVECSYNSLEFIIIENSGQHLLSRSSYMYPRFLDLPGLRNYLNLL